MYRYLFILLILPACASEYQDTRSAELLSSLNRLTTNHIEYLIRTYGTPGCAYSSKESKNFWSNASGDFRVIRARVAKVEPAVQEDIAGLERVYNQFQTTLKNAEDKSVDPSWENKCVAPSGLMDTQLIITRLNKDIEKLLR